MRMHCLRHVPFEDEARIGDWAREKGYAVTSGGFYCGDEAPPASELDWLVVMGGPMSVGDVQEHPWLADEKEYIGRVVSGGARVLGVCLGAQLLAECLGAVVSRNPHKEIGWFEVELSPQAVSHPFFRGVPQRFTAFHWHGDTFSLPDGAVPLGRSKACRNQGFLYHGRVLALQFHVESTAESVQKLLENCAADMTPGAYVQSASEIASNAEAMESMRPVLETLLARLEVEGEKP